MDKMIIQFERCELGVRTIIYTDYFNDGLVELTDIIEITGHKPVAQSRKFFEDINNRMYFRGAIIETADKQVVFEKFDPGEHRKAFESWFRDRLKETLKREYRKVFPHGNQ